MWRSLLGCSLLGCFLLPVPALAAVNGAGTTCSSNSETLIFHLPQNDPEIDRSPIWAIQYRRYLYLLGREMFWPELAARESFRIAVVGWPDLAENLRSKLDGRAIAGLPVDIVPLDATDLAAERSDFTVLFLGGTGGSEENNGDVQQALDRWNRKGNKEALIITDGGNISGYDLILRRRKVGDEPQLCIVQDTEGLAAKGMNLPAPFLQKLCP